MEHDLFQQTFSSSTSPNNRSLSIFYYLVVYIRTTILVIAFTCKDLHWRARTCIDAYVFPGHLVFLWIYTHMKALKRSDTYECTNTHSYTLDMCLYFLFGKPIWGNMEGLHLVIFINRFTCIWEVTAVHIWKNKWLGQTIDFLLF